MDMRICSVCGKQYDKCKTPYIAEGHFRWQDVACSPKCAMEYLARKEQAIKEQEAPAPAKQTRKTAKRSRKASTTKTKVESQPE